MPQETYDIVIVGAGPTGLLTGLSLAQSGWRVAVCGQLPTPPDGIKDTRTAALFNESIKMLENLKLWPPLEAACGLIKAIHIVDDMGHMLRAPELTFDAQSLNLQMLGWNVPNDALVERLHQTAADTEHCTLALGETVVFASIRQDKAIVRCKSGRELQAKLLVAGDGQHSFVRQTAGIKAQTRHYPQAALTSILQHERPHNNTSTEFHRPNGPFTIVPLPGKMASLVWIDKIETIKHAAAINDETFVAMVEKNLHGLLGTIRTAAPRRHFPLATKTAHKLTASRVVLVGEAAHAFPPIGAQGLNLSFRDIAVLTETLNQARRKGFDIGAKEILQRYQEQRMQDVWLRSWSVDKLNRSLTLTSTWPGTNLLRGGLSHAIHAIPILKQAVMRAGLSGMGNAPQLMRQMEEQDETST